MAYEFKKYSEVELLTEVPENATVLAEVDGALKRVPSDGLGAGSSDSSAEPDFVIKYTGAGIDLMSETGNYSVISGSVSDVISVIASGKVPKVVLKASYGDSNYEDVVTNVLAHQVTNVTGSSANGQEETIAIRFYVMRSVGSMGEMRELILKYTVNSGNSCTIAYLKE